ncbi:hypothetical protein D3C84_737040 [compost metagenome]
MQDQHPDAAEQQTVNQRLALIGCGHDCRLQGDVRPHLVFGHQAQVDVEGFVALRQRQHEVAAGQRAVSLWLSGTGVHMLDQRIAVEYIQIERRQIGCEHPQQLFMLAGGQPETQP